MATTPVNTPSDSAGEHSSGMTALLFRTMRPKQWSKNLFVLSPLLFSGRLFDAETVLHAVGGFFLFSFIASSVYVLNDIIDVDRDKDHPVKRNRPIASGALSIRSAFIFISFFVPATLIAGFSLNTNFGIVIAVYFAMNTVYSLFLKQAVIIDVMTIAASFVLRIVAGALVISVPMSEWLLICTSLLALFLGFSKRRHEIVVLEEDAAVHRPVLLEYSTYFLDQMIALVTASTLICYILYTVAAETVANFGSKALLLTAPFVLYGLFRYLYLVHQQKRGGDPATLFLSDKPLLVNVFLWALTVVIIIYYI